MRNNLKNPNPLEQKLEHPLSFKSLDKFVPEDVKFLVRPLVPLGAITVLEGLPGTNKTTYGLDLAAHVSTGQTDDLDGPAGVVFLSAEDGPGDTLRGRVEVAGGDLSLIKVLDPASCSKQLLLPDDIGILAAKCLEIKAKLVVIDPLPAFVNGSTSSEASMRRVLTPLHLMAQQLDLAVVIVRHLRKAHGKTPISAGGGSTSISGAARSVLLISEDPDDSDLRVIAHVKCNVTRRGDSRIFKVVDTDIKQPMIEWLGESTHTAESLLEAMHAKTVVKSKLEEAKEFLRRVLRKSPLPENSIKIQAQYMDISRATLNRAKSALKIKPEKDNFRGGWSWKLPEDDQTANNDHLGDSDVSTKLKTPKTTEGCDTCDEGDQQGEDDQLPLPFVSAEDSSQKAS